MTPGDVLNALLARADIDAVHYSYWRSNGTKWDWTRDVHQFTVQRFLAEEVLSQTFCITEEFLKRARPESGEQLLARQIANLLTEK